MCKVRETKDMPIDEHGNRCHLIAFDGSTVNRLNPSRAYEHYFSAAERDLVQDIRLALGFDRHNVEVEDVLNFGLDKNNWGALEAQYQHLLGYYDIVYPNMRPILESTIYRESISTPYEHLLHTLVGGMYVIDPPDNPIDYPTALEEVERRYPAHMGKVTWTGYKGLPVTSIADTLIGELYIMPLEKTAESWSAAPSAKFQHFGTNARLTNYDKYAAPGRLQPTKFIGEAEARLLAACCGAGFVAHLMDLNSSPLAHKAAQTNIMRSSTPTNIDHLIDRVDHPIGSHRPVQFVKHIFECSGKGFTTEKLRTKRHVYGR